MNHPERVLVHLPARADVLPHARVVALSCGTLAGLCMDRVDDLRQCTQEALAVLLDANGGDGVDLRFDIRPGAVTMSGRRATATPTLPDEFSFAWLLLAELADATAHVEDGCLTVTFTITDLNSADIKHDAGTR